MKKHKATIHLRPVPDDVLAVYRRRKIDPPTLAGPYPVAATWPYQPRDMHKIYAHALGYFWMPCILCGNHHGGHEITMSIPDPTGEPGSGVMICPACTVERTGGDL